MESITYLKPKSKLITLSNLDKQKYPQKPLYKKDINGLSSKVIFKFMTTHSDHFDVNKYKDDHPLDVDDFERNRALLLWYPEWRKRLPEMGIISDKWLNLVNNWNTIEKMYNEDYEKYGNGNIYDKKCCNYIRSLVK
jgi:hypothetical protein